MSNSITVSGSVVTASNPTSTDYCVITGYLQNILGANLRGTYIVFRYFSSTSAISTNILLTGEKHVARADTNGKVSIKLLQGTKVKVEIPGRHLDMIKMCNIPSALTANLVDIVFPRVVSVAFAESSKTKSVGEICALKANATMSDGETLEVTSQSIFVSSNTSFVSISGNLATGKSSGTSTISLSSIDVDSITNRQEPDGDVIKIKGEASPDLTNTMSIVVT